MYVIKIFMPVLILICMVSAKAQDPTHLNVDHAKIISHLDDHTLQIGRKYYQTVCAACHGKNGTSNLAAARSFNTDSFKFGADPYSIWKSIIYGAGQMGAQKWLSPDDAYAVVQYIREEFVKDNNPEAYYEITEDYLASLPKSSMSPEEMDKMIKKEALSGSQEFGQEYYSKHPGNYGRAMYHQLKDHAGSGLIISLTEDIYICYNVQRMSVSAVWKGDVDFSNTKYHLYRGEDQPQIEGEELDLLNGMHWSFQDRYNQLEALVSDRTPYPDKWLDYHGHYQNGQNTILSYSILGREILEIPSVRILNDKPIIQQTINIGPGDSWRKIIVGKSGGKVIREGVFSLNNVLADDGLPEEEWIHPENSLLISETVDGDIQKFLAIGVHGDTKGMRWMIERNHQLALFIPPSIENRIIQMHRYTGQSLHDIAAFSDYLSQTKNTTISDPADLTAGGSRLWKDTIKLRGALDVGTPHYNPIYYKKKDKTIPQYLVEIPEDYPYVVDRIPLPFNNPWNSWIRPSGLDFFPDGRLVISTYPGDIWLAEGVDDDLNEVSWRRIATGLFDPFGVKIVNNRIYVICRDRIIRLEDLNGDGETDFYESFFADTDVSHVPVQAFNYSLQTDSRGHFYYAKGGQYTTDDEPGHVLRISPDGQKKESLAIGFRAPNGVTVSPDDQIFVSDNQGNWMPANKINKISEGHFYGFIPTFGPHTPSEYRMKAPLASEYYPDDILPDTFDKPMIWLPQEFDNSPGEGAWSAKDWGPLGNRLIHTSYGKGWVYQVLMQEVDGVTQAAVSALPFQFPAGTQRARINPVDGQYYIAGITGWDDAFATRYGSLNRIRYIGGEGFFIDAVQVKPDGVEITFNQQLDPGFVQNIENFKIKQWNYRWSEQYGSADWSARNPEMKGRDSVIIERVTLSNVNKSLLLNIADSILKPVDQMRIELAVKSRNGLSCEDVVYLTIHKIPNTNAFWSDPLLKMMVWVVAGVILTTGLLLTLRKII